MKVCVAVSVRINTIRSVQSSVGIKEVIQPFVLEYVRCNETEQGIQFLQIILHWCSCQQYPVLNIKLQTSISVKYIKRSKYTMSWNTRYMYDLIISTTSSSDWCSIESLFLSRWASSTIKTFQSSFRRKLSSLKHIYGNCKLHFEYMYVQNTRICTDEIG